MRARAALDRVLAVRDARVRDDRHHLLTATRIKLTVLALLAAAFAGWGIAKALDSSGPRRALPWRDLTPQTGPLELPNGMTREFISRPQLAAWLRSRGGKVVPRVAFPRWRVALISLGPRSTTAYSLRVLGVSQDDDRVIVRVARRNATLADPGRPKLTFPYRLITLPTTGKPIQVAWVEAS